MKVPLDKVIEKIVALGVPGLILVIVVAAVGPAGGAAIVTALAVLGGPFGMWGGLAALGLLLLITNVIAEYGVEGVAKRVIKGLEEKGLSKKEILDKVESYPISKSLKLTLKELLN